MVNSIYSQLTVRLYLNPKFGKQMAPNYKNPYLFNASLEFHNGGQRLFADLADFTYLARSIDLHDFGMIAPLSEALAIEKLGYASTHAHQYLAGQLFQLNPKASQPGALIIDMMSWKGFVFLLGGDDKPVLEQKLNFRFCAKVSSEARRVPDYIATNVELKKVAATLVGPTQTKSADQVLQELKAAAGDR